MMTLFRVEKRTFVLLMFLVLFMVYFKSYCLTDQRFNVTVAKLFLREVNKNFNPLESPSTATGDLWWFLKNGTRKPIIYRSQNEDSNTGLKEHTYKDRLIEELKAIPVGFHQKTSPIKKILMWNALDWLRESEIIPHRWIFKHCPVGRCSLTEDRNQFESADAIVFLNSFSLPPIKRPKNQIWIFRTMESPLNHVCKTENTSNFINWTATYRRDSDIPFPYGKWFPYPEKVERTNLKNNFAANKTHQVAWVVSYRHSVNKRYEYARELGKHISIDIYGKAVDGNQSCPGGADCFKLLGLRYKFYLAFENSNCKEYITEKFFRNALENNMLPIVMGARPKDYASLAPPHSFIHVDDFASPKELARYLKKVNADDDLYNTYFRWKGTGEIISGMIYRMCNFCAKLHEPQQSKIYNNLTQWFKGDACIGSGKWPKDS